MTLSLLVLGVFTQSQVIAFVEQESPSYVNPDDIVIGYNKNFESERKFNTFLEKHKILFNGINNQLAHWNELESWAKKWNYDQAGFYNHIAREEKQAIIEREFLRYFKRQTRRPLKDQLKAWQVGLQRNFELDEDRVDYENEDEIFIYDEEAYKAYQQKKQAKANNKGNKAEKKISLSKKYKLRIKPRVFRGKLITRLNTPYVNIHSVLGVNKQTEISFFRHFIKARTSVAVKLDIGEKVLLASVDKAIGNHLRLRFSTQQNYDQGLDLGTGSLLSVNFFKKF